MRPFIHKIVSSFYQKAINDILIGYHFHKFNHPDRPEILSHHLERITGFWEMQLMQKLTVPLEKPFTLIFTHLQLGLKKGELGRWVVLFMETLEEINSKTTNPQERAIIELWEIKIEFFKAKFESVPHLFQDQTGLK